MSEQQQAIDELEKIWEAVIPFHPLLNAEWPINRRSRKR